MWVKMAIQFEALCGPKFMTFWDDVGDPRKKKESVVKYKSADNICRAA